MRSFLKEVVQELHANEESLSDLVFLVPSKRAGLFLKKELLEIYDNQTLFAPLIVSVEEFISTLSGLQQIDNVQTLFEFYETYLNTHTDLEKEDFETFSNWAQTLVYDFNEIDRYCIDHKSFFTYLSSIQDLNHWYLQKEKTELVKNYIKFWDSLLTYYNNFRDKLLSKKVGYQGLLYRKAAEDVHAYIKAEKRKHILVGFNALNNAEQIIFQSLLEAGIARVYWDADTFFFENKYHEAALFLRNYKDQWGYYKENSFDWIQSNFSSEKDISLIGVAKNVGQAKAVGQLLSSMPTAHMEKTALVLADEGMLQPVLNVLPATVESLNITMGLPLKDVPLASFFELLFHLHKNSDPSKLYYKTVLEILNNRSTYRLLGSTAVHIANTISKENMVYVSLDKLLDLVTDKEKEIIVLLFGSWKNVTTALQQCQKIVIALKSKLDLERDALELEHVYHFYVVFNKVLALQEDYKYLNTLGALHTLYKDVLMKENLDFSGEPFSGLQLMGMLESRCLDFETVIITSVNEGVLPAGKSMNSFIPYDLKRAYHLPTYKEKDAIYTYHFYRLIQRAKKVYLVYNTENEGVGGGEKSRFLLQLDIDKRPKHKINSYILSANVPKIESCELQVEKNQEIISKLKELVRYGLSPSALTSYVRNPMDFYYRYVLGVKEVEGVEETIAANTLGTVIHNTLEEFYKPLEGKFLTINDLAVMQNKIDFQLKNQFKQEYAKLNITNGKNLLIYEVAKQYIHKFLKAEEKLLNKGAQLKIIAIESNLKTKLDIPELDAPVYIKGKVDRIDELDGELRIIDYKTGRVTKNDLVIMDWDVITQDYKYSKVIQVLAYAYMQHMQKPISDSFSAGIISFKNLQEGFLKFGTKASVRGKANNEITNVVFDEYCIQLKKLILEIFNLDLPFIQKEV